MDELHAAIGVYPNTTALHDGNVSLGDGSDLVVEPLGNAGGFGRLVEDLKYDVFELPIVSFMVAQQQGIPIVGIPVFITRRFHHSRLLWNLSTGVKEPTDIAHRRAGVRYHAFTDATWARGILSHDFGLDAKEVTWVTSAAETVVGAPLPPNVAYTPGASLEELFLAGDLVSLMLNARQELEGPGIEPMFPNLAEAEDDWFERTDVVPINHLLAIKQSAIDAHPHLIEEVTEIFQRSKETGLAALASVAEPNLEEANLIRLQELLGADPLPFGIDENRAALEMIIQFSLDQQVLASPRTVEMVFARP